MSVEHTHRSGPRVYHAEDGDYTQKIEDKDGRVTHVSQQGEREANTLERRQLKTVITCAHSSTWQTPGAVEKSQINRQLRELLVGTLFHKEKYAAKWSCFPSRLGVNQMGKSARGTWGKAAVIPRHPHQYSWGPGPRCSRGPQATVMGLFCPLISLLWLNKLRVFNLADCIHYNKLFYNLLFEHLTGRDVQYMTQGWLMKRVEVWTVRFYPIRLCACVYVCVRVCVCVCVHIAYLPLHCSVRS